MTNKHTPGPWVYESRSGNHPKNYSEWGRNGLWGPDGEFILGGGEGWDSEFEGPGDEDARLIAAAPELLEALEALKGLRVNGSEFTCFLYKENEELHNKFYDAIKKARGE